MLPDSPYLVAPGKKFRLKDVSTDDAGPFKGKADAVDATAKNLQRMDAQQELLYAGRERAVLIVFQALDGGGKDGAIEHVFSGINPQGCAVTSFKVPTHLEAAHDFLWRVHLAVPPRGMIGIFNRSHYESVLVERVKRLVPPKVWQGRYAHINAFERMLADDGVVILKFFLHISRDEQKQRFEDRLKDPAKHWKFEPGDLETRARWDEYQDAYQDLLRNCSTPHAPWYVVPADRKWFRNWVVSDTIARTLAGSDLKPPKPLPGLDKVVVE